MLLDAETSELLLLEQVVTDAGRTSPATYAPAFDSSTSVFLGVVAGKVAALSGKTLGNSQFVSKLHHGVILSAVRRRR